MSITLPIALIFAGLVFVFGCGTSFIVLMAAGMSDSPSASADAGKTARGIFLTTVIITILLIVIHFAPIHWTI